MAEKFNKIVELLRGLLIKLGIITHKMQHIVAVSMIQIPLSILSILVVHVMPIGAKYMEIAKYSAYLAVILLMVFLGWLVEYFGDNDMQDFRNSLTGVLLASIFTFMIAKLIGIL